jgi:hypothetical protein
VGSMRTSTKAGALGAALGILAVGVAIPSIVSGNDARDTFGNGMSAAQQDTPYVTQLTGGQEVPGPGDADGTGTAAITIDRAGGEVCWDINVQNITLPATAAHIHRGAVGVAGGIEVTLSAPNATGTAAGCTTVGGALATEIATNPAAFYVNVHTTDFGGGAVRGQLGAPNSVGGEARLLNSPVRVYDSRVSGGILKAGETRTISLQTGMAPNAVAAVPAGASGAIIRVAATDTAGPGFLKAFSAALTTEPATAALNWDKAGAIIGGELHVAVDAQGRIKITGGVNDTHVVIDVQAFIF